MSTHQDPHPLASLTLKEWRANSNKDLAKRFKMKPAAVHQWRRNHVKPKGPRSTGSGRPKTYDLSKIDWRLSNKQNAARVGCTYEYIYYLRKQRTKGQDFA